MSNTLKYFQIISFAGLFLLVR